MNDPVGHFTNFGEKCAKCRTATSLFYVTPRAAGPRVKGQLTGEGHCVQVHLFKVFGQDPKAEV